MHVTIHAKKNKDVPYVHHTDNMFTDGNQHIVGSTNDVKKNTHAKTGLPHEFFKCQVCLLQVMCSST